MRTEDFETTQFLSICSDLKQTIIQAKLEEIFKDTNFSLVSKKEIAEIKLDYFSNFVSDYFFELQDETFMGEFDEWADVNYPPNLIKDFVLCIENILKIKDIDYLYIILTNYACKNETTNAIVDCGVENIYYKLFSASSYWVHEDGTDYEDSLIIKIKPSVLG